jgi:hypothetical protein
MTNRANRLIVLGAAAIGGGVIGLVTATDSPWFTLGLAALWAVIAVESVKYFWGD